MKKILTSSRALIMCALLAAIFAAPALADYPQAAANRTVVYFGAPW